MSDISQRIADLSPVKRALFELQQKKSKGERRNTFAIAKRAKKTPIPLSFAQQRLWYINQLEPDSGVYNNNFALRLKGSLNSRAVKNSLQRMVSRHESLRTTFKEIDGLPFQVIVPHVEHEIVLEDLQSLTPDPQNKRVEQAFKEIILTPFDLEKGPLFRTALLCLDTHKHILLVSMHHIITDGWSKNVFLRELAHLYTDYSLDNHDTLPDLAVQYGDFSQWQHDFLQGGVLARQLSYWKQRLADPPVLDLPTDRPRQPVQTYRGAKLRFILDEETTQGIVSLCRNENATIFMALFAAFNVLLFRYTSQEDILVGTPIANRIRTELEDLIGFFANTLVLRTDLAGNPSFKELLIRVRDVAIGAFNHQDLPFEKLVEELLLERDLSRNPLFQVMFVFQNTPVERLDLGDVSCSHLDVCNELSKFDLTLEFSQQDGVLSGCFEYSSDLFDQKTIERMSKHYQILVEGIIAHSEKPISKLPMMSNAEQEQILIKWNYNKSDYPRNTGIQQLFENNVRKAPEALAVIDDNQILTYAELNRRANQLAHYLQTLDVGSETLVGICMERSIEMIVSILGIIKAGGAYVPLDPSYPRERLSFILEDCQAPVLLTQKSLLNSLPETGARLVCLGDQEALKWKNEENPTCKAGPDNLAYVMHTSGSTGTPKGVAITHRGIARLVYGQDYISFGSKQRFLLLAPISFDASTFELWGALLHGGSLVVYPERFPSIPLLDKLIQQHSITTLFLTSSLFNMIVDQAPQILSPLQELLTGGEALSVPHVRRARQKLPHVRLVNGYGPTESTAIASYYPLPDKINEVTASVPIGRPIAHTRIYILDKFLQPVPIGVAGEVYIGGDGLARGYLNRYELTAEKFITDPFSPGPGAKLYRTGDQGRYLCDGNIEFLGRLDYQVKIRGFRIELGEIEATLSTHPNVLSCVIATRDDNYGSKQLIAYFVPTKNCSPSNDELQSFLSSKLPGYMVPAIYLELESLPLTPSGKINRHGLPNPDDVSYDREHFVAPRTKIEVLLTKIWSQILHVEQISIHDNFFKLGGHSLTATRIASRIRSRFNLEMPLRVVFDRPTIAGQARFIEDEFVKQLGI